VGWRQKGKERAWSFKTVVADAKAQSVSSDRDGERKKNRLKDFGLRGAVTNKYLTPWPWRGK